ncbi:SDR family oxidoreductase [Sciscionella sediminilitoris]|uniref:SDR family oxidoreductase n=1 Tax=Sciscionella sediminilitoris TaxID=1445613 RepID=UPI0004DED9F4|nr:SDR family NAD(P)-dependent oxidoreductase [Sciscionella sp. SE31]
MRIEDKVVVITGGAGGIGSALARRFATEGARGIVVADLDEAGAAATADAVRAAGGAAVPTAVDVSREESAAELVSLAEREFGPVDLFCANAGVTSGAGIEASAQDWARAWSVNVLPHVYAAHAVLPSMLDRGAGYLLNTASAAGLLTAYGDAPYSVSKHAAVAFGEWLAVTYGDRGIGVSLLCPMGVRTGMLLPGIEAEDPAALAVANSGALLEPDQVAETVLEGLAEERLHILPHPEVATMYAHRAADPDRWAAGMRRFYGGGR